MGRTSPRRSTPTSAEQASHSPLADPASDVCGPYAGPESPNAVEEIVQSGQAVEHVDEAGCQWRAPDADDVGAAKIGDHASVGELGDDPFCVRVMHGDVTA